MVELAGGKPAVHHDQGCPRAGGLVDQLRSDQPHRSVGDSAAESPPPHAAFHRGDVEIFDLDGAVFRQLGGELVGCFPPQIHATAVQPGQFGFRCPVAARSGDTAGKLTSGTPAGGQGFLQRCRVGVLDQCCLPGDRIDGGHRGQGAHPQVHPGDHGGFGRDRDGVRGALGVVDRDEQPPPLLGERHVEDAGTTGCQVALHAAGVLHRVQPADHRNGDRATVIFQAHRSGGEPHATFIATADRLEPRETHRPSFAGAVFGVLPITQCCHEIGQPGGVALFAVVLPPRRHLGFGLVPRLAEIGEVPRHRHVAGINLFGVHIGFDLGESPVERFAAGTEMRAHQRRPLRIGGPGDLELRRGHHPPCGQRGTQFPVTQVTFGVPAVEGEQHRHLFDSAAVALEIHPDVNQPRQGRGAVLAGITGQLNAAGGHSDPARLRNGAQLDDHGSSCAGSALAAVNARMARLRAPRRP